LTLQGKLYLEYAITGDEEVLHEARKRSGIILKEVAQMEEQLAGEPEKLAPDTRDFISKPGNPVVTKPFGVEDLLLSIKMAG
jgi:hypothetical protein